MSSFRLGKETKETNIHIDTGMAYKIMPNKVIRGNDEDFYFMEQDFRFTNKEERIYAERTMTVAFVDDSKIIFKW